MMMLCGCRSWVLIIWSVLLSSSFVMGYKPVIIVHGLLDGPKEFKTLANFIKESHPGTEVNIPAEFDYATSMKPMWKQVEGFRKAIKPIMDSAKDGVHLICFSQGGLICRGVLATLPSHNVDSVIFLSSPLAGQYGETSYLEKVFPFKKSKIFRVCYNNAGQKLSICNYWKDPNQFAKYLENSVYLAPLNGEILHPDLKAWRNSFLRLKKLVLIGGQDDGVITPWQSSLFGFYDDNEMVVDMEKQDWYRNDAFGLKTLNLKGAVVKCVVPGVKHTSWHSDPSVYKKCIDGWLT